MSSTERSEGVSPARGAGAGAGTAAGAGAGVEAGAVQHPRSFKLRFAAQRVPGHSYLSAVRPLQLPALVTDKFWSRVRRQEEETTAEAEQRAAARVRDMFHKGPREKHDRPALSSHEYGWWAAGAVAGVARDPRLQHHLRDSEWLKVRMRVLAEAQSALRRR